MATPVASTAVSRSAPVNVASGGASADASNGNTFANDGATLLVVRTTGTAVTPSVAYAQTLDGIQPSPRALTAAATTATTVYGPFPPAVYGTSVTVTWSVGTGVTFFALQPSN